MTRSRRAMRTACQKARFCSALSSANFSKPQSESSSSPSIHSSARSSGKFLMISSTRLSSSSTVIDASARAGLFMSVIFTSIVGQNLEEPEVDAERQDERGHHDHEQRGVQERRHCPRSRSAATGVAVPDTGRNVLMMPMGALSAPRQRKPLESHGLDTSPRVHHAARRRGGGMAAGGAGAAGGDADDRLSR